MIKVGIVGGTGYTGVELLRLLTTHPDVALQCITSRGEAGRYVRDLYPSLRGHVDLPFSEPDPGLLADCDLVFFATPHGVAQSMLPELLGTDLSGPRIIDISADFRLRDRALWEQWYGQPHGSPELIGEAVYGLPEMYRESIKSARLVACPGCYPTAILLGLMPLIEAGLVDSSHLVASAASGTSGAGRSAKVDNLLSEAADSYKSYGVTGHRHLPEIEQELAVMAGEGQPSPRITFVPHLVPMIRGMQASLYATLQNQSVDLQDLYRERYAAEPFVDVLPAGTIPQTRTVKTSNMCRLSVFRPQQRDTVVVLSVIDNLTKGSSGQAVQCMNLMFGLDEQRGLDQIAIMP